MSDVSSVGADDPLVLVSADAHVGPRLVEDLRPFCEARYLEAFDAFAADAAGRPLIGRELSAAMDWNGQTAGHYDAQTRIADMDGDGVAAEVIFHGSQNFVPLPFDANNLFGNIQSASGIDLELVGAGRHIYNRWLAALCQEHPGRHVGLAQLPIWDVDACVREVEWAAEAGLGGINFPAADAPGMPPLDDDKFENFYAACSALDMPLTTHVSAAPPGHRYNKSPHGGPIGLLDAGWWCRRSMMILTLMGAFERHGNLKLVLTEHPGSWWDATLEELDSMYHYIQSRPLRKMLPKLPSEYVKAHVWVGVSFHSHDEAVEAVQKGFADRLMWGSDYPHVEGTWAYPDGEEMPMTHLAVAQTYGGLPIDQVRQMLGLNAVECYSRLDRAALTETAQRIGAPRPSDLFDAQLSTSKPHRTRHLSMGFRTHGAWA